MTDEYKMQVWETLHYALRDAMRDMPQETLQWLSNVEGNQLVTEAAQETQDSQTDDRTLEGNPDRLKETL